MFVFIIRKLRKAVQPRPNGNPFDELTHQEREIMAAKLMAWAATYERRIEA